MISLRSPPSQNEIAPVLGTLAWVRRGPAPRIPPSGSHLVAPALSARCAHRLSGLASSLQPGSPSLLPPLLLLLQPLARARLPRTLPSAWAGRQGAWEPPLGRPRESARLPASASAVLRSPGARGAAAVVAAAPGMYQSPRRLCSALLQRDAPGLRRRPGPGLRSQSSPPAVAPRPTSLRLPAVASAAAARSCSLTGECAAVPPTRCGRPEPARNEWEPGRRAAGQAGKRGLAPPFRLSRARGLHPVWGELEPRSGSRLIFGCRAFGISLWATLKSCPPPARGRK